MRICRLKVLNVCNRRATETHFYNFKMIYTNIGKRQKILYSRAFLALWAKKNPP